MKKPYFPILCYHRVCPLEERGPDSPSLCVSPNQFYWQMALLKFFGYRALTPQDLIAYLQARKNPPCRAVLITFDDGYEDNYRHAFPILKKFSFTAVVFLITGFIGKKNVWDSGRLPLLNESQIREMQLEGIVFGSHTENHVDLTCVSADVIRGELENSRSKLEQLSLRLDTAFCYPYARLNETAKKLVEACGYTCAFAGDSGCLSQAEDLFNLKRIQVFPSTSLFGFWKKLQPWYPKWMEYQKKIKS